MVDDDGSGIPPAERERVFEPLYSRRIAAPRPATVDKGTGLGLATVRALTTAMGGTAEVADAPDGGARVVVRLPLSPTPLS
jgi:signal transduction histidine kinase